MASGGLEAERAPRRTLGRANVVGLRVVCSVFSVLTDGQLWNKVDAGYFSLG